MRNLKLTCSYSIGCVHKRRVQFRDNDNSCKEKQNWRNDPENGEMTNEAGRGFKGRETDHSGEFMHIRGCSIKSTYMMTDDDACDVNNVILICCL
jgi:hypothetical protein